MDSKPPINISKTSGEPLKRDRGFVLEKRYVKRKLSEEDELFKGINDESRMVVKQRVNAFMEAFLKNNGNATKAAMEAFGILNKAVAAEIGSYYWRKCRELSRVFLEEQGVTIGDFINTIATRAKVESDPEYIRMLARLLGIADVVAPETKGNQQNVNVNILQEHRKVQDEFGFGNVVEGEIEE